MNWKNILPKEIDINNLSLEDCRNFKKFHGLIESIAKNTSGPPGYRIFYQFMHHLLFYGICCIEENKFPALSKCWSELSPLFLTPEYDCEWLVFCWMFCDFPLDLKKDEVLIDYFATFLLGQDDLPINYIEHFRHFHSIMKSSRLGLHQEILSTSKVTKYRELFTKNVISTVRSVPYYNSGEIFLTRIVSYLGDSFAIHDSKSYPPRFKDMVEDMVRNKMESISTENNETENYERFMKLAGPYWMSCTHGDESVQILLPDEYKNYY